MSTGHPLTDDQILFVRRNFSDMTNQELADHLGVSKSSVSNVAKRFCLHKSKEHDSRMGSRGGRAACASANFVPFCLTPEVIAKRVATFKDTFRSERARRTFGLPQRTKLKVARQPRKKCDHRAYLKRRGYILDDKNLVAYWTPETRRATRLEAKPRRYYTFKQYPQENGID